MPFAFVGASRESFATAAERFETRVESLSPDDLARIGGDLFAVAGVLHNEGALRRALADPALTSVAKTSVVESLLGDRLGTDSVALLRDVVAARWSSPRDLVDAVDLLGVHAVLASAERSGQLDEVEDELFRFARILENEPGLTVALADPTAPADARLRLVDDVLEGRVAPASLRLVEEAVVAPRGRSLDRALEDYVRLAAERRSRLVAEVWSAAPLTGEQTAQLGEALRRIYGRDIAVQATVDPALRGGVLVRVGDDVIDGSIATRLSTVRRRLAG